MFKKLIIVLGVMLMSGLVDPGASRATEPELAVLPNGLQVVVQQDDRFPLVAVRLYVRAGSTMEEPEKAGISHVLEHMVFKGHGMAGGAADRIEAVGGYINAATSFDYTMYMLDLPDEHLGLGLDVLKDMIFNVSIDKDELERETKVVISELARGEDSPGSLLFKKTQGLVWNGTKYATPIIGYRETLATITPEDVEKHIARLYQPQSMVLVVCGNVSKEDAVAEAERCFGDLKNDHVLRPPQADHVNIKGQGPRIETFSGPWNKVYASCAFPLPSLHSEAAAPLEVLGYMLGGDETSLLYRRFRYDLRLVDDISASVMTMQRTGVLYIRAILDADKVDEFWTELNKTLSGLSADAFDRDALDRAVINIEDSLHSSKETLGGLAAKLGYFQFFEGGVSAEDNYLYTLEHMGLGDIGEAAREYLCLNKMNAVMLAPQSSDVSLSTEHLAAQATEIWPETRKTAAKDSGPTEGAGETEIVDLPGGRKLVLIPDDTIPYVSLRMVFTGGDMLLDEKTQGLAALASEALTQGTGSMSATEYQDYLSDRAASLYSGSGRDAFVVSAKYPARFEDDMIALFEETLTQPAFKKEEIERVRDEQKADIEQQKDRALGLAFRHMFPFLFPDSTYGFLHLGSDETLAGLDRGDVVSYWKRQRRQPWVLAASGAYDRDKVVELAKLLARNAEKAEPSFPDPAWTNADKLQLDMPGRNQTHLLAVFPAPGVTHEDNPALRLLRKALAGQGGILFRELREQKGLGYSVTAMLWQTQHTGFMAFYIGTTPEEAPEAMQGFKAIAERLGKEGLPDEEIDRAKNLIKGEYYRDHQSLSSRGREAAGLILRGLPADYNREVVKKAGDVSAEELRKIAEKYIDWDRAYIVRIDPQEQGED